MRKFCCIILLLLAACAAAPIITKTENVRTQQIIRKDIFNSESSWFTISKSGDRKLDKCLFLLDKHAVEKVKLNIYAPCEDRGIIESIWKDVDQSKLISSFQALPEVIRSLNIPLLEPKRSFVFSIVMVPTEGDFGYKFSVPQSLEYHIYAAAPYSLIAFDIRNIFSESVRTSAHELIHRLEFDAGLTLKDKNEGWAKRTEYYAYLGDFCVANQFELVTSNLVNPFDFKFDLSVLKKMQSLTVEQLRSYIKIEREYKSEPNKLVHSESATETKLAAIIVMRDILALNDFKVETNMNKALRFQIENFCRTSFAQRYRTSSVKGN